MIKALQHKMTGEPNGAPRRRKTKASPPKSTYQPLVKHVKCDVPVFGTQSVKCNVRKMCGHAIENLSDNSKRELRMLCLQL